MTTRFAFGLMAAFALSAGSAEGAPFKPAATVGKSAKAFAPATFKVESETKAELTGDGITDLVVVLVSKSAGDEGGARALLFLRGEKSGDYTLMGSNGAVLPGPDDCGVNGGDCKPDIVVKKNVVSFTITGGSRESWSRTLRFRPNGAAGKVELIGRDERTFDGLTEQEESTSINYVTKDRVVTKTAARVDDDGKEIVPAPKATTTKDKAPVELQALELLTE